MDTNSAHEWRDRLAAKIAETGRSKRDISRAAGLGPNYVSQLFREGRDPTLGSLAAIAAELNVSVSELMGAAQ